MIRKVSTENPSCLTFKQPKKIPNLLVYARKNLPLTDMISGETFMADRFNMADTQTGKYAGKMISRVLKNYSNDEIYPHLRKCDTYKIELLKIKDKKRATAANL